jgi:hypothetical protein
MGQLEGGEVWIVQRAGEKQRGEAHKKRLLLSAALGGSVCPEINCRCFLFGTCSMNSRQSSILFGRFRSAEPTTGTKCNEVIKDLS